ncbi:MAG: bifunctional fucokinase/L-fucose-1-P-guanylyltransferase [Verrucomicrobiales bacterium]|nr:bifunctional fucokinase/L-fucose-1-P-guanylyltransferase [Verrucomicrobiales bacterium]
MQEADRSIQCLISLPPRMVRDFANLEGRPAPAWFAGHDPVDRPLGSGGGTAHLLVEAWRATGEGATFEQWLAGSRKLILHAGGQSRRLPAYAATGKILMPIPVFRWARGQRLDQTLLDVQLPDYARVLRHAPEGYPVMIASGDVLLRFESELPAFPGVDVLGLGMWTTPEIAQDFGVFFVRRRDPDQLAFFLQKPAPDRIRALAAEHLFLVDTGMWLLSHRAVQALLRRCGWNVERQAFEGGSAQPFEMYAELGLGLGDQPTQSQPEFESLTSAVVPLSSAEFHHFGTSRQMIESLSRLQNRELDQRRLGTVGVTAHPDQHVQNARIEVTLDREANRTLWIENSHIGAAWKLAREHVLTGVPANRWAVSLEAGVCLDFVPVEDDRLAIRCYGIDDLFAGPMGEATTRWLGRPVSDWFRARGLDPAAAGCAPGLDIQQAPLFAVLREAEIDGAFLTWLGAAAPETNPEWSQRWLSATRLSARRLQSEIRLDRFYGQRAQLRDQSLPLLIEHRKWSVFHRLDLDRTARGFARLPLELPAEEVSGDVLNRVHEAMFRAAVVRHRGGTDWEREEARAFAILRDVIVGSAHLALARPRASVVEDQIVWSRSPVRFDLAGGWTDTPPYCLEHGGQVVNVGVDLNGQPPMQVFARLSPEPRIVLRSIDLGCEETIRTYAELDTFATPDRAFALAKAACALAGFLPRFHATGGAATLQEQLAEFGAGIELSLLSAVPKGSGLGTSSILAATVLAALGEVCGLGWDQATLFARTLALEQMIGTGGGWQDQAGGLFGGLKLIETTPGLNQVPRVRWLPDSLVGAEHANRRILLYYTGMTRLAKSILAEIVRGIFLNSPTHLATLHEIGAGAHSTALALERCDYLGLGAAIRNTWRLKQQLDAGTNPPAVAAILEAVAPDLLAATLPGAGGGGYLLMFARDDDAAARIRRRLTERPPNPRARFVQYAVSRTGLQVTRS